jgi:hypothetical protein
VSITACARVDGVRLFLQRTLMTSSHLKKAQDVYWYPLDHAYQYHLRFHLGSSMHSRFGAQYGVKHLACVRFKTLKMLLWNLDAEYP